MTSKVSVSRWCRLSAHRIELVGNQLTTGYRSFRGATQVTRASFRVEPATIVALVGPNGCGKTTLLQTIVGLLPPLSGEVMIGGLSPAEYRARFGIGYLPEGLSLPGDWSGRGLLGLAEIAGGRAARASTRDALEIAGVDFDLRQPISKLSQGMRQRLALAIALLPLPALLLLDEPESGLDPAQRIRLRGQLRALARTEAIIVLASHDISGLGTIADQTYLLTGQSLMLLQPADLDDPDRLLRLFAPRPPT
jgi:ABC-type multidrug transport system ATPase subunit